ncbi:MAG TPA: ATP-binding protein [Bacteroidales bacterium]
MRHIVICKIVFALAFWSFVPFSTKAQFKDESEDKILESLIEIDVHGQNFIPSDSVFALSRKMTKTLENNGSRRALFELKRLEVLAYIVKGQMNVGIEKAQSMYNLAQSKNYQTGIAISIRAIGDTYMYSGLIPQARESYIESYNIMKEISEAKIFLKPLLMKIIYCDLHVDKTEEAGDYLKDFKTLLKSTDNIFWFYCHYYSFFYNAQINNMERAFWYRDQAVKTGRSLQIESVDYHVEYLNLIYLTDKGENEQALDKYNYLLGIEYNEVLPSSFFVLLQGKAELLVQMERLDEACEIYQQIYRYKENLNLNSYIRQIDGLRAKYQADRIEFQSRLENSQTIRLLILIWGVLLLLVLAFIMFLKHQIKQLVQSKKRMNKAKEKAEISIKVKSIFLMNMTHEIRTPLNALLGFSSILSSIDEVDEETRLQCVELIKANSKLLHKLINDVLDISRLESHEMHFNFRTVDAIKLCRDVVDTVKKGSNVQVEMTFVSHYSKLMIQTDSDRLQQVLINLLVNATKFTTEGSITLALKRDSDTSFAMFAVTDTGKGIPEEKRTQVFDRFVKLNEYAQGSGLGLAICRLIVERLGGKIWVDPGYLTGARFIFTHPIHEQQERNSE